MMSLVHTCYRVGDLSASIAFYAHLGFTERRRIPIGDSATNVFLGLPGEDARLELTYNHGTAAYDLGTGYGHIALALDDLDGRLRTLAAAGIEPERAPYRVRAGGPRLCFVRDPDGYRIELLEYPDCH